METLKQFSEKDRDYHEYQARQNFLRQQRSIQSELEAEREGRRQALAENAEARAEIERLKALLEEKERKH